MKTNKATFTGTYPAFSHYAGTGITNRDYFAAMAMQGLLAFYGNGEAGLAETAYEIADNMLEEKVSG